MRTAATPFSLYIHIPYCAAKCPYCDFNVHVAARVPEDEYADALARELEFYSRSEGWRGRSLKSVFFGGGTPSLFSPRTIGAILDRAAALFATVDGVEVSLEANPGAEDQKHFSGYRACGIDRLSLGAQSFQPHVLKFLGRLHSAEETRAALRAATSAGFENFSLDLIYAVPGQSAADLDADLAAALEYSPPHLSAYNLTIEEGTPFARQFAAGKLHPLAEDEEVAMAEAIEETLARAGLERYEISNYARPGRESKHNATYWRCGDYLGIGAGAHSYLRAEGGDLFGLRWHDEKNPVRYIERVRREGSAAVGREELDRRQAAGEFMFMGLRMTRGVDVEEFFRRFGKMPADCYPKLGAWMDDGLMEREAAALRLTRRGLALANEIFVAFV